EIRRPTPFDSLEIQLAYEMGTNRTRPLAAANLFMLNTLRRSVNERLWDGLDVAALELGTHVAYNWS
ncbi:MAG: hypothetical protein MI757_10370, partial [Pirellulales bacterium]|nr:hypothetical protein [Pirellulales bacterium]